MHYQLSGIAMVTGASRGIGRAIAERLASAGMKVAVAARTQNELEDVAQAIGGIPLVLDVTDREGVARAVDIIEHELGAIDLLVNNAGIIERRFCFCDASGFDTHCAGGENTERYGRCRK